VQTLSTLDNRTESRNLLEISEADMTRRRHFLQISAASVVWLAGVILAAAAESKADNPAAGEASSSARFDLVCDLEPAYIVLAKSEHKGLMTAAKDLQRDITKITGVTPNIVHSLEDCAGKCVVIGSADCPEGKTLLASVGLKVDDLAGRWETYKWRVLNNVGGKEQVLAIAGSNVRGAIFGVYEFERLHMGVDPFWFWADHDPPTRGELTYDASIDFGPSKEPTWKYRGWTLNDHPQFMEWMESGLVQRTRNGRYMFAIHHDVFQRLMEAALRLRMNMFTWYFIDIDWQPDRERLQAVFDRGMFLTQQQMEAVGADTGFWDSYWDHHNRAGKPEIFSYLKHPESFREFWGYYIRRWSAFSPQVVWELSLRGWADASYQESTLPRGGSPEQLAGLISNAIADQVKLIRQIDPNPNVEMMTTLYNELGHMYDKGWIKIPPEVTTGFADAAMNGMSYSKRFWTDQRDPKRKYGQYFHTQYFGGGPQIAKCTPIETYLKVNMDAMYQRGDTQHMLLAMNELRHQQIELRGIAEMLWDYPGFAPRDYLKRYSTDEFGPEVADRVAALYDEYYEKYPHKIRDDGFKKYASYVKVMEPLFTVIGNLLNIESGNRDGFVINYQYNEEVYEQGIRDLGEVFDHAMALRPSIPEDRRSFFDYEFIDSTRQVRGIYKICVAANHAIAALKDGDRAAALAALVDARPLVEELYRGFKNNTNGERWQYWYRSGTNEDMYLMYNLYQKARLALEVENMSPVANIEPQRHPYLGNVVMHHATAVGDPIYSSQAERLNGSVYNGSSHSIVSFPLAEAFQIGGVRSTYSKWKLPIPDHGLPCRFKLHTPANVYIALQQGKANKLPWLAEMGFEPADKVMEVGRWGWPYRYRNRPPEKIDSYDLFVKAFPAGTVELGPNPTTKMKMEPYVVFVQPSLLAYENFHADPLGQSPPGWAVAPHGAQVVVVANPDYEGEMRPTVFDLSTVRRYRPLGLKSLRLATTEQSDAPAQAELRFQQPADGNFVLHLRAKPARNDRQTSLALITSDGKPAATIAFTENGRIASRSGQSSVEIAPYEAGRWYNLKLRVLPAEGKIDVTVQDDRIQKTERKGLKLEATGPLASIRLVHPQGHADSKIDYDAIVAWPE
jgi:hypothetical protein